MTDSTFTQPDNRYHEQPIMPEHETPQMQSGTFSNHTGHREPFEEPQTMSTAESHMDTSATTGNSEAQRTQVSQDNLESAARNHHTETNNLPATSSEDQTFTSGVFDITVLKTGRELKTGIINFAYHIETMNREFYAGRFSFDIRYPYQLSSTPDANRSNYQSVLLTQHYEQKKSDVKHAPTETVSHDDTLDSLNVERIVFCRSMDIGTARAVYRALSKAIDLAVQGKLQVQQPEPERPMAIAHASSTQTNQQPGSEKNGKRPSKQEDDNSVNQHDTQPSIVRHGITVSPKMMAVSFGVFMSLALGVGGMVLLGSSGDRNATSTMPSIPQAQNLNQQEQTMPSQPQQWQPSVINEPNNSATNTSVEPEPLLWSPQ